MSLINNILAVIRGSSVVTAAIGCGGIILVQKPDPELFNEFIPETSDVLACPQCTSCVLKQAPTH
jgi:hypothetical protein